MKTARDIARIRNCHVATVSRVAVQAGVGKRLGNMRLFTEKEAKLLCRLIYDGPGNPGRKKR